MGGSSAIMLNGSMTKRSADGQQSNDTIKTGLDACMSAIIFKSLFSARHGIRMLEPHLDRNPNICALQLGLRVRQCRLLSQQLPLDLSRLD